MRLQRALKKTAWGHRGISRAAVLTLSDLCSPFCYTWGVLGVLAVPTPHAALGWGTHAEPGQLCSPHRVRVGPRVPALRIPVLQSACINNGDWMPPSKLSANDQREGMETQVKKEWREREREKITVISYLYCQDFSTRDMVCPAWGKKLNNSRWHEIIFTHTCNMYTLISQKNDLEPILFPLNQFP